MKNFLIKLAIVLLFFTASCKDNKSNIQEVDNQDSIAELDSVFQAIDTATLDIYQIFEAKKKIVLDKLESITKEQANLLCESYQKENEILISRIKEKELFTLDKYLDTENKASVLEVKKLDKFLNNRGLRIEYIGEGYTEINVLPDFYYNLFRDKVTDYYKEYLKIISIENEELYASDGGLVISFQQIGERIYTLEKYLEDYPENFKKNEVTASLKNYQYDYLFGLDNTPTIERYSDTIYIYEENLEEFKRFEKKYSKSPTVRLIKIYLEHFKEEEVKDLIEIEQEKIFG